MRATGILGILAVLGFSLALDIKNPQGDPANKGRELGNRFRDVYGGDNKGDKLKQKLLEPASRSSPSTSYTLPKKDGGEQVLTGKPAFCGYGETKEEKVFAKVKIDIKTKTVNFSYASNPYTGNLDKSLSYSGKYLCSKGACDSQTIAADMSYKFTGCKEVYLNDGVFNLRNVDSLDNCVDLDKLLQSPTFFTSYIQELVNHYHKTNQPIIQTKTEEKGWEVWFYGGKLECQGVDRSPPQTQYYKNPYVLSDHSTYYYTTCNPQEDKSCKAVKGIMESEKTSTSTCYINRGVSTTPSYTNRTDGRVCSPNAKLYPDGYTESSPICFSGDRFLDFSSSFWLECSSDGKSYELKGWGYWEGAPCNFTEPFPPLPQVKATYYLNTNIDWVEVGRLSVNRRRGGEALSEGACVSDPPTPYKVKIKNTYDGANNVLEIEIENAPSCNRFKFSQIQSLPGETISGCEDYQGKPCKVINEWWVDANNNKIQVIKNGMAVAQLSGCEEILRDEENKVWTSATQTAQAPPQNCSFPPKTCKTIEGKSECRQWWQKIREYKCADSSKENPNLSKVEEVLVSANYDPSQGKLTWKESQQDKSINIVADESNEDSSCPSHIPRQCLIALGREYLVKECNKNTSGWTCPIAGEEKVAEDCKCPDKMTTGLGMATSSLGIIQEALKDKVCQ